MTALKAFWATINRKIKAVAIASVVLAVISILNAIVSVYPNGWWTPIATALILVLTGYQTSATPKGTE